jgi:hypothetical protein
MGNWLDISGPALENNLVQLQITLIKKLNSFANYSTGSYTNPDDKPSFIESIVYSNGKQDFTWRFPSLRRGKVEAGLFSFPSEVKNISESIATMGNKFNSSLKWKAIGSNHLSPNLFIPIVPNEESTLIGLREDKKLDIFHCDKCYIWLVLYIYGWRKSQTGHFICYLYSEDCRDLLNFEEKFISISEIVFYFRSILLGERNIGTSKIMVPRIFCDENGKIYDDPDQIPQDETDIQVHNLLIESIQAYHEYWTWINTDDPPFFRDPNERQKIEETFLAKLSKEIQLLRSPRRGIREVGSLCSIKAIFEKIMNTHPRSSTTNTGDSGGSSSSNRGSNNDAPPNDNGNDGGNSAGLPNDAPPNDNGNDGGNSAGPPNDAPPNDNGDDGGDGAGPPNDAPPNDNGDDGGNSAGPPNDAPPNDNGNDGGNNDDGYFDETDKGPNLQQIKRSSSRKRKVVTFDESNDNENDNDHADIESLCLPLNATEEILHAIDPFHEREHFINPQMHQFQNDQLISLNMSTSIPMDVSEENLPENELTDQVASSLVSILIDHVTLEYSIDRFVQKFISYCSRLQSAVKVKTFVQIMNIIGKSFLFLTRLLRFLRYLF